VSSDTEDAHNADCCTAESFSASMTSQVPFSDAVHQHQPSAPAYGAHRNDIPPRRRMYLQAVRFHQPPESYSAEAPLVELRRFLQNNVCPPPCYPADQAIHAMQSRPPYRKAHRGERNTPVPVGYP